MADINVDFSGPVFDGRADQAIRELKRDIISDLAAQGYSEWMQRLNASIRHPTPYYETQITVSRIGDDSAIVNDRGIIYGPWLEGTSRRNQTTRFKGYASRRRAIQALAAKVPALVRYSVDRCVNRMGG